MAKFTFDGEYRRTKGETHTYRYEAEWVDPGEGDVTWSAVVTRGRSFCGAISGTMKPLSTPRTIGEVRKLVEQSIEDLNGIDE